MSARAADEPLAFAVALPIVVRRAHRADLGALEWFGMFTPHRAIIARTFAEQARGEQIMLVADARDFPIGQAWLDLVRSRHDRTGVVWAVRVFPVFQRMGIGACLMKAAENVLRAEGFERAQLGVERSNPRAARFYERLGYTVTGQVIEEHRYTTPDGDEVVRRVDQWVMRKDLG